MNMAIEGLHEEPNAQACPGKEVACLMIGMVKYFNSRMLVKLFEYSIIIQSINEKAKLRLSIIPPPIIRNFKVRPSISSCRRVQILPVSTVRKSPLCGKYFSKSTNNRA